MRALKSDCQNVRGLLEAFYEGVVEGRQQARVAAHLARCESCRAELAQIAALASTLETAPRVRPGPELFSAITARVAALPTPVQQRELSRGWVRIGVIAACLVTAFAGVTAALPLLLAKFSFLVAPTANFLHLIASSGTALTEAGSALLAGVSPALDALLRVVWLALPTAAPIIAGYVLAEIALVAGTVLVCRRLRTVRSIVQGPFFTLA